MNFDESIPARQSEASMQCNNHNQTAQKAQTDASERSRTILRLGCQGLLPQDIARETGIPVSTVYRHYWMWFGKRRALSARRRQAVEQLKQIWQQHRAESERL